MSRLSGVVWERDPGVPELIEYLADRETECIDPVTGRPSVSLLHPKEQKMVMAEINKCQDDFVYAARNYFWIVNKKGEDIPFNLWKAQELVLDHYLRLKEKGVAQKIIIIKARRLGCSTLIEGLIAWKTMFFPNQNAMVISYSSGHSADLYNIMVHIYEMMPWWLKPMVASLKMSDGLVFDNPDPEKRRDFPGLRSKVTVQSSSQLTGVGQGYRISAAHASEFCDYPEDKAKEIIEEDLGPAVEGVDDFFFLESTAKGAGRYAHKLWRKTMELGETSKWTPVFLPWFFENSRTVFPLPQEWALQESEKNMRERIERDWVRCNNENCGAHRETVYRYEMYRNQPCPECLVGTMKPVLLTDSQLCWMWKERRNAEFDMQSQKTLKQEYASTSEEAFQISGYQIFSEMNREWVMSTIAKEPESIGGAQGFLDDKGNFHGYDPRNSGQCYAAWCKANHRYDPTPLIIYEFPEAGYEYVIGGDVAEGLGGEADFSVGFINRIGHFPNPDVHVATYRSNEIDPISFAAVLNFLGRWYNEALMSVEVNVYDSCFQFIRYNYQYPNLYRWKHLDSTNPQSNKWGWWTNQTTKSRLWQTARKWFNDKLWVIRSPNFFEEMKTFQKEDPMERGASAEDSYHDDEVMAGMIALYTTHEMDWDENIGAYPLQMPGNIDGAKRWTMQCPKCRNEWQSDNPDKEWGCPNRECRCKVLKASMNAKEQMGTKLDWENDMLRNEDSMDNSQTFDAL